MYLWFQSVNIKPDDTVLFFVPKLILQNSGLRFYVNRSCSSEILASVICLVYSNCISFISQTMSLDYAVESGNLSNIQTVLVLYSCLYIVFGIMNTNTNFLVNVYTITKKVQN